MNDKVLKWLPEAEKWSRQTKCPTALILAVIQQESGGNAAATRHEPKYEIRYATRCREIAEKCKLTMGQVASSYGLMQLMLPLAWGYMSPADKKYPIVALIDANRNIRYGAAHLATLLRANNHCGPIDATVIRKAAGAYNGAGENSQYARNVCALWQQYTNTLKGE